MKKQDDLAAIWIVIIVIIAIIFGAVGGYYYFQGQQEKDIIAVPIITSTISPAITSSPTTTSPINETSDWKTYTNNEFGYTLKYPKDYKLSDQCYDSALGKKIDYSPIPQWLVIIDKNMDANFPFCQSDFPAMDLIVSASIDEVNINEQMEFSDTDIESEEVINGITWAKQIFTQPDDFDGQYRTSFYTNYNGNGYTISTKNTDSAGNHNATVDEIIETFEFTQ